MVVQICANICIIPISYYLSRMKVSAFSYVRNGLELGYPFLEAIRSVLPLCDEVIVVIGDSRDGTREAVEQLNDSRVKIVDTIWDDSMRQGGLIFSQQSNIGMDHCNPDADWLFHIQADEVVHEEDVPKIRAAMELYLNQPKVEGLLFRFLNFYGNYQYYAPSRRYHQHEIRIIRNDKQIRSYRDSQGFRRFDDPSKANEAKGEKLHVKEIDARIFHYSYVKPPAVQKLKQLEFGKRYYPDDQYDVKVYEAKHGDGFNYHEYDYLRLFKGTHPALMQPHIQACDWQFSYDPSKNNMTPKEKLMKLLEELTGKQFFIYKNYKRI